MFYTADVHWREQIRPISIRGSFYTTEEFVCKLQMVGTGESIYLELLDV